MKKLIVPVLLIVFTAGCRQSGQDSFTVEGSVKNADAKTIYLEEASMTNTAPVIVDSANLDKNGKFELSTLSKGETIFNLRLNGQAYPMVSLINDKHKVRVTLDPTSKEVYTVKGSDASEALRSYLFTSGEQLRALYNSSRAIDSLRQAGTADSVVNLQLAQRSVKAAEIKSYTADFIGKSKSPSLTLFALGSYQSMASNPVFGIEGFSQEEVKKMVQQAAAKAPNHEGLAQINKSLQQPAAASQQSAAAPASLVNKPAPDFTLPDVNGKSVSLSSFKGKWVLVDFWASWCQPCRMENPNVVKAFNEFKHKNFTILGVSLDRAKEPWLEAIGKDSLSWTHVSDLKFWNSSVVPLYNIEGIPYNVLINPQGIVVAESLRGEELEKKLAEVL